MRLGKIVGWALLALVVIGLYPAYRLGFGKPFTLNQLADRQGLTYLMRNPEAFTEVGLVDGTIFDWHSGKLTPVGVKERDSNYALYEKLAAEVRRFDRASLNRQEQITYDILLDQWQTALAYRRFPWLSSEGLYPIAPMWGTQVQLVQFMISGHVVKNDQTAQNYVKRLRAMGDKLDGVTAEMQRQAQLGVVLPLALLERAEQGIRDTVAPAPKDNPLVTSFKERMQQAGISASLQRQLSGEAALVLEQSVYPAFGRMIAALEAVRPAAARQAAGVSRLPDGAAYYALALKAHTTTNYTPEQVHQLGLKEVARITAEMDQLLRAQGLDDGTVGVRMQALREDPRYLQPNTDEGRQRMLAIYQRILDDMSLRLPRYFRTVPKAKLRVERVPVAAEKGSSGAYYQPAAMDGSRLGTFFANLRDTHETASWMMNTLAYHEGVPGHHLQISTALNLKGLPLVRQQPLYNAYTEGWALYAEQLAAEMGMYKDDKLGDLGRLQAELFRSARLVVDTGLHAKGWTREQAIKYMVDVTGMSESEVTSEVERYMGQPGQACAYKVGELKILELRRKAKAGLGSRFDIRDFHAVVLENGAVPLTVLEKLVDEWIASASQGRDQGAAQEGSTEVKNLPATRPTAPAMAALNGG